MGCISLISEYLPKLQISSVARVQATSHRQEGRTGPQDDGRLVGLGAYTGLCSHSGSASSQLSDLGDVTSST